MKFGIVEIGSTVTKAYVYKDGHLTDVGSIVIMFKKNYNKNGYLLSSDTDNLIDFIKSEVKDVDKVYAFGTSIFRNLDDGELKKFLDKMQKENIIFEVVTQNMENKYTVKGVITNLKYDGTLAVAIGGDGSIELALVKNGNVLETRQYGFGVIDVNEDFPDLKEDVVHEKFEKIAKSVSDRFGELDLEADTLVLAGGDFIYFYEMVPYDLEKNVLYENELQPLMLKRDAADRYDKDIMSKSLNEIRSRTPGNEAWWECARAMRVVMNVLATKLDVQYIIPTKINMVYGLLEKIKNIEGVK